MGKLQMIIINRMIEEPSIHRPERRSAKVTPTHKRRYAVCKHHTIQNRSVSLAPYRLATAGFSPLTFTGQGRELNPYVGGVVPSATVTPPRHMATG